MEGGGAVTTAAASCCVVITIREAEGQQKAEWDRRNPSMPHSRQHRVTAPRAKGPPKPCGCWRTHRRAMTWWSVVWISYSP